MKSRQYIALLFQIFLIVILGSACGNTATISKRYHQRGFHIAWSSHANSEQKKHNPRFASKQPKNSISHESLRTGPFDNLHDLKNLVDEKSTFYLEDKAPMEDSKHKSHVAVPQNCESHFAFSHRLRKLAESKNVRIDTLLPGDKEDFKSNKKLNRESGIWSFLSFILGLASIVFIVLYILGPYKIFALMSIISALLVYWMGVKCKPKKFKWLFLAGVIMAALTLLMFKLNIP